MMEDLSLHILDLAENSTAAGATLIEISVVEDLPADLLTVEISDNGRGMRPELVRAARDPFVTTRTTRKVGLGLPMFAASCEEAGGAFEVRSEEGRGSRVRGTMRHGHVDRRPLGDLAATVTTLLMGSPDVDWVFRHRVVGADGAESCVEMDTREIREQLGGVPINDPEVVRAIEGSLREQAERLAGQRRPGPDSP